MKRLLLLSVLTLFLHATSWAYDFSANYNGVTIYYNILSSSAKTCEVTYQNNNYNSYSGDVVIPERVTYGIMFDATTYTVIGITSFAFYQCTGLSSITIGESVTSIGRSAFQNCTSLTEVTIPNSVTEIGDYAFQSCTGLTSVTIGNSVTSIGSNAFEGCKGLTEVTIPNSVTTIGNYAFEDCTGLMELTIPNSVTSIGNYAFYSCSELNEVTIGESVTSIGSQAFYNCTGLTQFDVANGNEYYCSVDGVLFTKDMKTLIQFPAASSMTSYSIPNSVTEVGDYSFRYCTGLTEVTIPESVTTIGKNAFAHCDGLTQVNFNAIACTSDGYVGYNSFSPVFSNCANLSIARIGDDVTQIPDCFFYSCSGLTSVTIGNSVTSIGSNAFEGCKGLTEVTIPNSVTSIGSSAFNNCTGLTEITIPNNVTSIGSSAFAGCTGLIDVAIEDGAETLTMTTSSSATPFTNCPIETLYLGRTLSFSSSSYPAFRNNTSLASLTIGEKVTNIPSSAFYGCTGLTSVSIGNSVTTIGASSFYNCSKLTEIAIPESVTSIGDNAFYGCSRLWSISNTRKTQTTCTMTIESNISGAESGIVYYNNKTFYSVDDDGYYTFTDLTPGSTYSYYFGIKLDNGSSSYHGGIKVTTIAINPQITQESLTPESFTATGSYTTGDANVTAVGFTNYETDGVTLYLTNLEPKTQYTVEYYVTASGKKFTASTTFTTPAVELTTLPAKATSNTVALLGATTNLSDDAVGAGFEWRRNDAPSTMPSNQAECPVIDGELTGTLNGLSATTYYDFRPYYTSQGGVTYYGDWITFITADAYVYFEPTVRTYSATSVGSSSATVKAYAVAGSDNITSQGFEYWEGGSSSAMNVRRASTTDGNGVTRVEVSGQWMTATLEDLEPSTTYSYRAYVTTAVGTTYGETMSFTTDVPTGIEGTTLTEDVEVYEIARYTLDGKKISHPQRGINVIRYSDGTAKKVLVK